MNNQVSGARQWDVLGDVMPGCLVARFAPLRPASDAERCRRSGGGRGLYVLVTRKVDANFCVSAAKYSHASVNFC